MVVLHYKGSRNPIGLDKAYREVSFHPFFSVKDAIGFRLLGLGLSWLSLFSPFLLGEPENFLIANTMVTPNHIQPEWYFLFAYAILRRVPRKLGGVVAIVIALVVILCFPIGRPVTLGCTFNLVNKHLVFLFLSLGTGLT